MSSRFSLLFGDVLAHDFSLVLGNRFVIGIRDRRRILVEELSEVLELHRLLANVAEPNDERNPLSVAVGSPITVIQPQARLQAADFLAPGGVIGEFRMHRCAVHGWEFSLRDSVLHFGHFDERDGRIRQFPLRL